MENIFEDFEKNIVNLLILSIKREMLCDTLTFKNRLLINAELDVQHFGMYDDCGDYYINERDNLLIEIEKLNTEFNLVNQKYQENKETLNDDDLKKIRSLKRKIKTLNTNKKKQEIKIKKSCAKLLNTLTRSVFPNFLKPLFKEQDNKNYIYVKDLIGELLYIKYSHKRCSKGFLFKDITNEILISTEKLVSLLVNIDIEEIEIIKFFSGNTSLLTKKEAFCILEELKERVYTFERHQKNYKKNSFQVHQSS